MSPVRFHPLLASLRGASLVVFVAAFVSCSEPRELTADTTLRAGDSPHVFSSGLIVAKNRVLTIEPGARIELGAGTKLVVRGQLIAKGTPEKPIQLAPRSGKWARLELAPGSADSYLAYTEIRGTAMSGAIRAEGTTLTLDHATFAETAGNLLHVTSTSVTVRDCTFPTIENAEHVLFEGMPEKGHAIFERNTFGNTTGYNDVIDCTGGKRPGPIPQFRDNVFLGAVDDCIDLDGTDAHIEGNVFLNVQSTVDRESSSNAIAAGTKNGKTSDLVIARNIFFDCDHAVLLTGGATAVMQHNTVVGIRSAHPSADPPSVLNFNEVKRNLQGGGGAKLSDNIFWQLHGHPLMRSFDEKTMHLEVVRCLVEGAQPTAPDPGFIATTGLTPQNIRERLALRPDSPARGAGLNGLDLGALVPAGATIGGAGPQFTIGGPGITSFRYRVDNRPFSSRIAIANPIEGHRLELPNLAAGEYQLTVVGIDSAGRMLEARTRTIRIDR